MKKLTVECRLSAYELMMIPTDKVEQIVREKLARSLANSLLKELELSERMDCMAMDKVIRAEVIIATSDDAKLCHEAEKFLESMKEER